jgi:hypothetical protein
MIDVELETMNISLLRGHVGQFTQSISQLIPTTIAGRVQEKGLVAILEKGLKWISL